MCYISPNRENGPNDVKLEIIHEKTGPDTPDFQKDCPVCTALESSLTEVEEGRMEAEEAFVQNEPVISYADALILAPLLTHAINTNGQTIHRLRQSGRDANAFVEENQRLARLRDKLRNIPVDGLYPPPF